MDLIETLPYSLSRAGPPHIDGVGNYYVEVLARGSSGHSAITVYLLDSHSYSPNERKYKGYDWIKKNQIEWFRSTAQSLKKKHKEYTHHHMDVAFIHIPIPEYVLPNLTLVGDWKEPSTAPAYNSGFYNALVEQGVSMVSCGQYVHFPPSFPAHLLGCSRTNVLFKAITSTSTAASHRQMRGNRPSGCAMPAAPASAATRATAASTARSASSIST